MRTSATTLLCATAALALAAMVPTRTVTASSSANDRGAELFATKGCAHCHGTAGVGGNIGPDLQEVRKRMKKDEIAKQIHDGDKVMPAYGDQLDAKQIDDLVAYLSKKRKVIVMPPPVPAKPAADPDKQ